jgi:hypothetical protein
MSVPPFGFDRLMTEMLRGFAETVADRSGETETQRYSRYQTAIFTVMAFLPRDALETMVAGQCLMLHHLSRDGTRDLLRGQPEMTRLRTRSQLIGIGRLFLKNLEQLIRLQARPIEQTAVVPRAGGGTPPEGAAVPVTAPAGDPPEADAPRPLEAATPASPARPAFQNRAARRAMRTRTKSRLPNGPSIIPKSVPGCA